MKKALALVVGGIALASSLTACAYGGVGGVGADKVVIARNDGFLFGALRKVFVCKVTDAGVSACQSADSP
jgi:hypothetical protein